MIYHSRQLISLTLVRQESLLTFSVGFMGDSHKLYTYSTPIFTYMVIWSCLGKNTGNNTKQLTSLSQHPIPPDDEIHASRFQPEASSVSAPPCKVGGHWRLQNGYLCKMYENFRIVIMMVVFWRPFPTFSLRCGELFWFSQSSWDVSTLSTQHSQRKHFPILCPSTKEIIACCMLKHEHLEPFRLGGLSSHAVILTFPKFPEWIARLFGNDLLWQPHQQSHRPGGHFGGSMIAKSWCGPNRNDATHPKMNKKQCICVFCSRIFPAWWKV